MPAPPLFGARMDLKRLPRTLEWIPTESDWVPSALAASGLDEAAAHLRLVDQRELPHELTYVDCFTATQVCDAIADLTVRGAPALGVAGAFAVVLWAKNEWPVIEGRKLRNRDDDEEPQDEYGRSLKFLGALKKTVKQVASVRPTAVNLSWGAHQILDIASEHVRAQESVPQISKALEERALEIMREDELMSMRIGKNGARVLSELARKLGRPLRVETHCNAGSLATVYLGTATAVIYTAMEQGNIEKVWVDETRPVDQGARLTAWELGRAGVPYTLICDDMAASLMKQGQVDAVIVGADRICANGDVANKIGTYQLAVLAKYHDVPFYVAAPETTFDSSLATGDEIVIEQRDPKEVRCMPSGRNWLPVAPKDAPVYNPAFDVTPHELITDIISDREGKLSGAVPRI